MKRSIRFIVFVVVALVAAFSSADVPGAPPPGSPLAGVSLRDMRKGPDGYFQQLADGRRVHFTVIPDLQQFADELFAANDVPAGAAVVLNSRTGRVLALSQYHGEAFASPVDDVALDASPPAASIFKIVTTSALLEKAGVNLNTELCYHGGGNSLQMENLIDSRELDSACRSLKKAFGFSTNAVYAKLSDRHLPRDVLHQYAERFGFGRPLPFDVAVSPSEVDVPAERLEKARAAAGFWHSHLSPLHGAMIAQSIAQDGAMLKPYIVERVEDAAGRPIYEAQTAYLGRTVEKDTARLLREAMTVTVTDGTARKGFREGNHPVVPGIQVAGKTGTLNGKNPYRAYSWFVGLAPADKPEVAIAVLIVNSPKWRIKSSSAAAAILREYFNKR